MTELLVALGLIIGVVAAHELGFWLGSLIRSADEPFDRQVALVRTSTAALVAFLIGFALCGRSVDDHRPGLPGHRHYQGEQSQYCGNPSCYELSVIAWCKLRPNLSQ